MKINTSIISKRREYILKYLKEYPDISTAELAEKIKCIFSYIAKRFSSFRK